MANVHNLAFGPMTRDLLTPGNASDTTTDPIHLICRAADDAYPWFKDDGFCFNMTVELGIGYWITVLAVALSCLSGFDGSPTHKYIHAALYPSDRPPPNFPCSRY